MALLAYALLLIKLPGRLSLRYGLINIAILGTLLGSKAILAAIVLTCLLWALLKLAISYRDAQNDGLKLTAETLSLLIVFAFFIFHKLSSGSESFAVNIQNTAPWVRADLILPALIALSFSYVFLRCFDLIRSVIWDQAKLLDPISLLGYIVPFHMLVSGPVALYENHLTADEEPLNPEPEFGRALLALNEITTGLFYKFVIAEAIRIYFWGIGEPLNLDSWLNTAIFLIYLFFDFAGYSKVALGLGILYRIHTPDNFNKPFLSCSMTEFWTRWHISLGIFVRRNIFYPVQLRLVRLMGRNKALIANILTLMLSFGMVGLWHRFTWKFFVWGLAMGLVLAFEKYTREFFQSKAVSQTPYFRIGIRVAGPIYAFIICTTAVYFVADEIFVI